MIRNSCSVLLFILVLWAPLSSPALDPVDEEDAVFAAVLSQVADDMADDSFRAEGGVVCLSIDPGGAPQSVTPEFLAKLHHRPFLRRGAECERRPDGAVEIATDRPAMLIAANTLFLRRLRKAIFTLFQNISASALSRLKRRAWRR